MITYKVKMLRRFFDGSFEVNFIKVAADNEYDARRMAVRRVTYTDLGATHWTEVISVSELSPLEKLAQVAE